MKPSLPFFFNSQTSACLLLQQHIILHWQTQDTFWTRIPVLSREYIGTEEKSDTLGNMNTNFLWNISKGGHGVAVIFLFSHVISSCWWQMEGE